MKKIIGALAVLAVGTAMALSAALPASATPGPNSPEYWKSQYPNAVECYKYDPPSTPNSHGALADDGKAVVLNTFDQSWPGDRWEVLIVKSGSEGGDGAGNAVYPLPTAGTLYYGPLNGGGQQGAVSHWIVCKGETPPPPDVCPNIDGPQSEVPAGYNQDCTPPTNECVAGVGTHSTEVNDLWTNVDTRADGRLEYVADGLHVWTLSNTSQAKVSEGMAANFALKNTGVLALNWTGSTPPPGINLFVDFDNNGTVDGTLVYESVYGQDLWLTNGSQQFVKDNAPVVGGGNGSQWHGTINQWLVEFPLAQVKGIAYSLGSGVLGDGVIHSITVNCATHTFGRTPVPAPIVGQDVSEQVECESGEVVITTTPWSQSYSWNGNGYTLGDKVYGEPIYTSRDLTEEEYVECYGDQPDPLTGSDKVEECDDSILVITTTSWTQEYVAGETGWVLGEKVYADPKVSRVAGDPACYFPPALALTGDSASAVWLTGGLGLVGLGSLLAAAAAVVTIRRQRQSA